MNRYLLLFRLSDEPTNLIVINAEVINVAKSKMENKPKHLLWVEAELLYVYEQLPQNPELRANLFLLPTAHKSQALSCQHCSLLLNCELTFKPNIFCEPFIKRQSIFVRHESLGPENNQSDCLEEHTHTHTHTCALCRLLLLHCTNQEVVLTNTFTNPKPTVILFLVA